MRTGAWLGVGLLLAMLVPATLRAQDANAILREAVQTELNVEKTDRARWRYRDDERDQGLVSIVVQTDAGSVKRLMERNGHPLSAEEARTEDQRVQAFIHDPAAVAKKRRDGQSDDKSARELLTMMPDAFLWTLKDANGENYTLGFEPNPSFRPPDMEARVMGMMGGEMLVDKREHRMRTLSGRLTQDVNIGFGLLGRMKEGGTFRVERREIKPGLWQITETHVHIDGKALLFKSIGEQQDEIQTDWTQIPNGTSLEKAAELSKTLH